MSMEEPSITVGICDRYPEIRGQVNGMYRTNGTLLTGGFTARAEGNGLVLSCDQGRNTLRLPEIRLAAAPGATFTLHDVTIGVHFHWERKEEQTFCGDLILLQAGDGTVTAVNKLPVEEYLVSVVSSEMSGEAPVEFLKAHAVAARSWLVAMLLRGRQETGKARSSGQLIRWEREIVRWYDREDHDRFDVCADDHCQRYQGVTRLAAGRAAEAVRATRGVFLVHDGEICDARYHKACGGMTEDYDTCWEEKTIPYLSHVPDAATPIAPIRTEADAEHWILSRPAVYCNTAEPKLLDRILPAFDRETVDFFRWQVSYSREELEGILREKSGMDFGVLQNIVPVERGPSGRIRRLRIEGSRTGMTVGKELEIRRWLSPSHLKSSAFIVSVTRHPTGVPTRFTLYGAGWGHGVGLCQIGAAVMAGKGCKADEILRHYFRGTALVKRY